MLSPAQLAHRRTGITASEIGTLMGLSPFEGIGNLYSKKVLGIDEIQPNENIDWGNRLEEPIAAAYADRAGVRLLLPTEIPHETDDYIMLFDESGQPTGTVRSKAHPILMATVDRVYADLSTLVEIKAVSASSASKSFGEAGSQVYPAHYAAQVTFQMGVTGFHRARLVALVAGNRLRWYDVPWKPEWFAEMAGRAKAFWNYCVLPEQPPNCSFTRAPWFKAAPISSIPY